MIEVDGQLLVALQLLARDVGDHLFRGRLDHEVPFVAILDAQQVGTVFIPASGFLPQLARLDDRHEQLNRAGTIHLLAHDGLDLAQHTQAQRHPGIDAGREALDHARAQHQTMAGELGLGGRLLLRREEKPGQAHGELCFAKP